MWVELLLGATLLAVLLSVQREHMATGVYSKHTPPTDAEANEIFDQIMSMAPAILHNAYADALALAKVALADAKTYAAKDPADMMLKPVAETSEDKLVLLSKQGVVGAVLMTGRIVSGQGPFGPPGMPAQPSPAAGPITEEKLKAHVDRLYTQLNQHIDDQLPGGGPNPNLSPIQGEMQAKIRSYAEQARTLVKKYDTPEVRDACLLVLKEYYIDQLKPGWSAGSTPAEDPTAAGNMADLEAKYQKQQIVYNNINGSDKDALLNAKRDMSDTLQQMLALSAKSGTEDQQQMLIRRIMEIQRDYNGLLVATDDLETLRRINQFTDMRESTQTKIYGVAFIACALALLVMVTRTR